MCAARSAGNTSYHTGLDRSCAFWTIGEFDSGQPVGYGNGATRRGGTVGGVPVDAELAMGGSSYGPLAVPKGTQSLECWGSPKQTLVRHDQGFARGTRLPTGQRHGGVGLASICGLANLCRHGVVFAGGALVVCLDASLWQANRLATGARHDPGTGIGHERSISKYHSDWKTPSTCMVVPRIANCGQLQI